MQNIVVTTDLSEASKAAFPLATRLAQAFGAKIHLLAIKENPLQTAMIYSMDFPVFPDPELEKQIHQKLAAQLDDMRTKYFAGSKVEANLIDSTNSISYEILNFARNHKADLIIMATHGRSGLSRLLIGSVAERVVREAQCPVLTVPAQSN
ncbi:MAG: universal stress protein [Deltaproteobacteria bacterium]|nr:universal stress protein [Deltaproteobacteria bacterium]